MKIQFTTNLTSYYKSKVVFLSWIVFASSRLNAHLQNLLGDSEISILQSRKINVTNLPAFFYCDLPYDDCLCSVLSNKSYTSKNCITYVQLVGSRVLPLVSFFLQIYLTREIFTLSADRPRVIIYTLCIASIFTFIGMTISIYWNSCYHAYITAILLWTSALLFIFSWYNLLVVNDHPSPSSHHKQIIISRKSERNNKPSKPWEESV